VEELDEVGKDLLGFLGGVLQGDFLLDFGFLGKDLEGKVVGDCLGEVGWKGCCHLEMVP